MSIANFTVDELLEIKNSVTNLSIHRKIDEYIKQYHPNYSGNKQILLG